MKFQIGAMTVGDILDRSLKLLSTRLVTFYVINLIVMAPVLALELALPFISDTEVPLDDPSAALGLLGGALAILFLTLLLQPFGHAAILHIIAQEFVDQRATMGDAFRFALNRFGRLLGVSILTGLVIFAGLMLCAVPGILFAIWYVFAAQVVVVEGLGGTAAMERSKRLTEGFRGQVFGVGALLFIIPLILGVAIGMMDFVLPSRELVTTPNGITQIINFRNYLIQITIRTLLSILVQTFSSICWTLFYFDLRARKEGFDLEVAARQQTPQPL